MTGMKSFLYFLLVSLSFLLFFTGCEKKIEEDIIQPVEMMVGQKGKASSLAARTNVQAVRAALMRYPAVSGTNEYPGDMDIYDYTTLRQTLADANLPADISEAMWDPAYGVSYRSQGADFTFEVKALSGETIVATAGGVTNN